MKNYSHLFWIKKRKTLERIEENSFELESKIKEIIQNNFTEIFSSSLILLTKDRTFTIRNTGNKQIKKRELDDLVFDKNENCFYVFEYKKQKNINLIQQTIEDYYRT